MTRARILQEVAATEAGTAFVPWIGTDLADVLCVQEERVVPNDNTVEVTVRVYEYPDGPLAVFHGPRCLARYQSDGWVIEPDKAQPGRRGSPHGSDARPIIAPKSIVRENISARS
ncbi:hypothetical protein [Candidatus Nitrospira nitrificans]|uniref:Uncharacterized protein n=1 Tax=Candidatus Nitrospira nitrificans TaxID=1742973 RepID=A0A0S4LIA1_9BACT|nr:hypothetical protein [Candidatus Nitrospira nitrificans]CUS36304.1 hypothetical protein COMA2_220012 [Candidatus Nitrospira nitrificans]